MKRFISTTFAALLVVLAAMTVILSPPSMAQTAPAQCNGMYITRPAPGQVIGGITDFEVYTGTTQVARVAFMLNGNMVGDGLRHDPYWRMAFDTGIMANGSYELKARVEAMPSGTATTCDTPSIVVHIQNPPAPKPSKLLISSVSHSSWSGPTNVRTDVAVRLVELEYDNGYRQDVTAMASYGWRVTHGSISANGPAAAFYSGPVAGSGHITIGVQYDSLQATLQVPIHIASQDTYQSYPSLAPPPPASHISSDPAHAGAPSGPSARQGDVELEQCLIQSMGEAAYRDRIQARPRLTFSEVRIFEQCFAKRNYIMPANLAPVQPDKVRELPIDKAKVAVTQVKNEVKDGKKVLLLAGQAEPNKQVVIYVFSEPLILTTTADNNGQWTYTLENPLESGEHEIYVTVEGDDAQPVRSSGFGFAILSGQPGAENPLGLGLELQAPARPTAMYIAYIGATLVILLLAGGMAFFIIWRRHRKTPTGPQEP